MATRKQLREFDRIVLPSIIPCNQCRIPKAQNQYSDNRLEDLQKHIITAKMNKRAFDPKTEGVVRCSLCKGGPATEHQCYHCEITYPRSDRYFSKTMLKNRKDEALCWSCSQREQNDTLSDGEVSDSSGDSEVSFVTNQFKDTDLDSTLSDHTSNNLGKNSIGIEDASGGVPVNVSSTRSTGPGTTWTGMSNAGSTRGTATSAMTSNGTNTETSSIAGSSAQSTPARPTASSGLPKGFNPHAYSQPRGRSPPSSVAESITTRAGSEWSKVKAVPTVIDMDAARNQQKHMNRRAAAQKAAGPDLEVSDDSE